MTPILTLTTDFGLKDYFVGALKGHIYKELPEAKIVDISHQITPFSIHETAYVIRNAYKHFPKGSIHIIAVDAEESIENKHIVLKLDGHFFICADNGVMSLIIDNFKPEKIVKINLNHSDASYFLANFVKVACHLARGGEILLVGDEISQIQLTQELRPTVNLEKNQINGHVIYIDNYGNVVTNIDKQIFEEIGKGRQFEVRARSFIFNKIYNKYNDIENYNIPKEKRNSFGKKLALFNKDNFLEIALYRSNKDTVGGASNMLGLKYRDSVSVKFI
jgi:S-adenosylmethionine hydrolase